MNATAIGTMFLCIGLAGAGLSAEGSGGATARGPVLAGNGLPNGIGATLGRFFLLLERSSRFPEEKSGPPVPIEVFFTSSVVSVEATSCSQPAQDSCSVMGKGLAGVAGVPTTIFEKVMAIKLAGAFYFSAPDRYRVGSSIEMALEGSLYAGKSSKVGDTCELRLFPCNPDYLLDWGANESNPPISRQYRQGTGSGVLLSDVDYRLFPGWFRGQVVENDGFTLYSEFSSAEISPVKIEDEVRAWIRPDHNGARNAGLPNGVFGQMQVNYSGIGSESRILPGVGSNDVELLVTAVPQRTAFLRGDCNGDGVVSATLTDAITLLNFSFLGGFKPPCLAACDADGDGKVGGQVVDALYLLQYLFFGGSPPPPPFPACGPHPASNSSMVECAEPTCI